ncbi:MAG: hypothetical protein HYS12_08910 [Planctomycetes bacterium]|nr:hypothetical protein [Planctomycetota bacterium]
MQRWHSGCIRSSRGISRLIDAHKEAAAALLHGTDEVSDAGIKELRKTFPNLRALR